MPRTSCLYVDVYVLLLAQILGGAGYMRGNVVERLYREVGILLMHEILGVSRIVLVTLEKEAQGTAAAANVSISDLVGMTSVARAPRPAAPGVWCTVTVVDYLQLLFF